MSVLSSRATQLLPQINWDPHHHVGHTVQFYSDDPFLVESLSGLVGGTLAAGESAVVIATEAHRRQLFDLLIARGVDVSRALREGRYFPLDAEQTLAKFMRDAHPEPSHFSDIIGGVLEKATAASTNGRVVAFGEMVALLWVEGNREAALEVEQLWNDLAAKFVFSLHCAYPLSEFRTEEDAHFFRKICSEHASVIPSEGYTSLTDDEERLRNIAELQQKAQALEFEKGRQASLRKTNLQLESEAAARQEQLRKLGDSEQALRELSHRLIRSQEDERRSLGINLHDSVGQHLAVLKMALEMLNSNNAPSGGLAKKLIAECLPLLERSIDQLRAASYLLYPPMMDETGLPTAIRWYLTGFTKNTGIHVTLDVAPDLSRLPGEIELALFRALQESLANVHRHSGSSTAAVALRLGDGQVRLEVCDQGKGIAQEAPSFDGNPGKLGVGLRTIQERLRQLGGALHLSSTPQGTTLTASVPLP